MAGTAVTPAPVALPNMGGRAAEWNFVRISAAANRLELYANRDVQGKDAGQFCELCLSLARGIDYAVANNEVPRQASSLPSLLKQVCQRRNDSVLQAAVMVLMISVKNACRSGWFSAMDSEALISLANEIGGSFCSEEDFSTESSSSLSVISAIMTRFYPRMRLGQILAFLEVKPGYGAYVIDFHISRSIKSPPEDKIRLFVAQTDDIETSSCIITPPQVNFLLNGKGVERRTNVFMDPGPLIPTAVSHVLKYGTNLLQAVGQFNGNYIIAVAFMSVIPPADHLSLPDYVQPTGAALDSDSDIIEGPSRISLNCPISFTRIRTPVKGHSCKHLQCFDFDNYMDINSRRPSWRCPHCNQHVSFIDIRIDQNMVKVLKEVEEDVSDIIISADGSWKAVIETEEQTSHAHNESNSYDENGLAEQKITIFSNGSPEIMDLTEGDDGMDVASTCEIADRKPFSAKFPSQSSVQNLTTNQQVRLENDNNRSTSTRIEDDFWAGIYLSTYGVGMSGVRSEAHNSSGSSGPAAANNVMVSAVLTDTVSPAIYQESVASLRNIPLAAAVPHSQISVPNDLQFQPLQSGNSVMSNEYGMFPSISRHINRTPIAIQALPAQSSATVTPRTRKNSNILIQNLPYVDAHTPAVTLLTDGSNSVSSNMERQQQFSRSHLNHLQVSPMTPRHSYMGTQAVGFQPRTQPSSAYRVTSGLPPEHQNSNQQQPLHLRMPVGTSQSPSMVQPAASSQQTQFQGSMPSELSYTTSLNATQHGRFMGAAQRAVQMARQTPLTTVPVQISRALPTVNPDMLRSFAGQQRVHNTIGTMPTVTMGDTSVDIQAEDQTWQPSGRMRGSLSGQAYSAALSQYIFQPTQPLQATRPLSNIASLPLPAGVLSQLQNSMGIRNSPLINYASTQPNLSGGSGVFPNQY